jgi:hypothetical protein
VRDRLDEAAVELRREHGVHRKRVLVPKRARDLLMFDDHELSVAGA